MPALLTIRELHAEDLPTAFSVVRQLRQHLDLAQFESRVARQATNGYTLYGAFDVVGSLLGVLGMRPVTTLARGDHLHVDDLIVAEHNRHRGVGRALLKYAERWAENNSLNAVFLDSRQEVVSFYTALGYAPHTATLMRKRIDVAKSAP